MRLLCCLIAVCLIPSLANAADGKVRFDRDIRPILSDFCFQCHGPDQENREADLRLDLKEHALADRKGEPAFKAGSSANSQAWQRIISKDDDTRMPPPAAKKDLKPQHIALIKQWIEQGAEWTDHWAFVAPKKVGLPKVSKPEWVVNAIDRFVLARLESKGMKPTVEASRRTLIRRLSLDLRGLPPTPKEVQEFLNDKSKDAYEKLVDRTFASKAYGQRMAVMWLDAARYGDTSVYHADGPRDMWAWRDRIVDAYNENLSFDQFSIQQLAGDLIKDATVKQQIMAGFNRNNGTTDEGGAIAEEYRVEYAVDRVKTTSTVWLGLTMECGQCHDHKYDPISQEDYYRFFAFFNVSADGGMQTRRGNATPTVDVPDPEREKQLPAVREQLKAQEEKLIKHQEDIKPTLAKWITEQETNVKDKSLDLLPKDPLLHFTLDEGKGNKVADSVNAKRKGTIHGKAQWASGRFDGALNLNGGTHVDFGNIGELECTDGFSYGAWVNVPPKAAGAVLARMDNNNAFRGYDMLLSSGHIEVHIVHKWQADALKVRTKKPIAGKKWQHVFMTYDGSSKAEGIKVYVDGQPQEVDIQANGLKNTIKTPKPFFIGARNPDSKMKGLIDEVRVYARTLSPTEVQALADSDPISPILAIAADKRTKEQQRALSDYYLANVDEAYPKLVKQRDASKTKIANLEEPLTSVMVMGNMTKPRETFILNRGSYDSPTKRKVEAGTPSILPPMHADAPRNRLGMAQWLFQPEHPLTSRVAVNRYWQQLFGVGFVTTPEDFGAQGEFPHSPELLDWLAVDFRENGWNVKRLLKMIVMSATYRQSSNVPVSHRKVDPQNRLLGRGARFRLQGEFIRDSTLAISGLLVDHMGGPGVKPYQPPGLWKEVGLGGNPKFVQDHGDKLYRRSLYTYWKRSAPPPSMQLFDAPTREKCTVYRPRTNTPLQALVMLNDVQYVEAARNLAQRLIKEGGSTLESRVTLLAELAVSRPPRQSEMKVIKRVFDETFPKFKADPEATKKLLAYGESKRDESIDAIEHATMTIIASLYLNLDETLTRQ